MTGNLDYKAGLSTTEKESFKNSSVEDIYKNVKNQGRNLYNEVMKNIHMENMNKINDAFLKSVALTTDKIKDTIKGTPDVFSRYEKAIASKSSLKDDGIALAQALAEDCVEGIQNIAAGKTLKKTTYGTSKDEIDGYMGPNTTLLFETIAKTDLGNGTPVLTFDGTITPELILKMYNSCHTENIKQKKESSTTTSAKEVQKSTAKDIGSPTLASAPSIETQLNTISTQITTKRNAMSAIKLTATSTQVQKNRYKALMGEVSDLQEKKEALMTPAMIQKEIASLEVKMAALKKTIKSNKSNEFVVNSNINKLQSEKTNYEKLLKEKAS